MYHVSPKKFQVVDDSTIMGRLVSVPDWQKRYLSLIMPGALKKWLKSKVPRKVDFDFSSNNFYNDVAITRAAVTPVLQDWVKELEQLTNCIYNAWPVAENQNNVTECPQNLMEEIKKNIERILVEK